MHFKLHITEYDLAILLFLQKITATQHHIYTGIANKTACLKGKSSVCMLCKNLVLNLQCKIQVWRVVILLLVGQSLLLLQLTATLLDKPYYATCTLYHLQFIPSKFSRTSQINRGLYRIQLAKNKKCTHHFTSTCQFLLAMGLGLMAKENTAPDQTNSVLE